MARDLDDYTAQYLLLPFEPIQAAYRRRGRDLRATLRLLGDALGISVADVGAQIRGPAGAGPK